MKRILYYRNIANFKQWVLHESWDFVYLTNDLQDAGFRNELSKSLYMDN